jgi:hypothetical protein
LNILLFNLANTAYGKDHDINFDKDDSYEVLKYLPLIKYQELYPYIKRVWDGESSVLWPGKITYFGKSI